MSGIHSHTIVVGSQRTSTRLKASLGACEVSQGASPAMAGMAPLWKSRSAATLRDDFSASNGWCHARSAFNRLMFLAFRCGASSFRVDC